jgi:hypothetical protein
MAEPKSQVIVAVDIDTSGSDRGLARPAIEALHARGWRPSDYLVDGGFTKRRYRVGACNRYDIVVPAWAHQARHRSVCAEAGRQCGRGRLAQALGRRSRQKIYRRRAEHECINARGRRMGLQQLTVRGKEKARTVLLWFALAHTLLRSFALGAAAQVQA